VEADYVRPGTTKEESMTKKNYIQAAELIRKKFYKPRDRHHTAMVETFADFFREDNPRFDEERFRFACNREVK
jgi:hypothetical protein